MGSDPVMLELFRAELDQHLPVLNEGLLDLEKGRAGRKEIESMMRAAHSIKGAGRVMGIDRVVRVAHALEDCFSAAKDARITLTPDSVDVLLAGVDFIQRLCSPEPGDAADEAALGAMLERIGAVGAGAARSATPVPAPTAPAPPRAAAAALQLAPSLDRAHAESLRLELLDRLASAAARADASAVILDFTRVERVGPEALALFASLDPQRSSVPGGPRLTATGVGAPLRSLFRVTGLDGVLTVVD
ncbi:MAG: Hpt domain-containing protein [Phycisphaerales bacterium]